MNITRGRSAADQGILLGQALVVGVLSGTAAVLLRYAATALPRIVWPAAPDLVGAVAAAPWAVRLAIPVAGAVVAGWILGLGDRFAGSARGWEILEAVLLRNGVLPMRPALVKSASSLVTVATAGAVGREGPIVLLAGSVASWFGRRLRVSTTRLRLLVGCGVASGLACAYNAPLAAALFTLEIVFGSLALELFAPLALASATATLISWAVIGRAAMFNVPSLAMASPWEAVGYAALGVLGGLMAVALLEALRASAAFYRRIHLPRTVAMATAGLVLGVAILAYPELVGNGREAISALFERPWSLRYLLALLALRLVVTPLAVGSGTVGGVFTPTLFLGAVLGQAFGTAMHAIWPQLAVQPAAFALAGMGCVLAGTTHAPLMSVVMVFEMTLDYGAVIPLLVGSTIASLVATQLTRDSVYTEALRHKASAGSDEAPAAIDALRVADLLRHDQATVSPDSSLPDLLDAFIGARRNNLYLTDAEGRLVGVVNLHDVNAALKDRDAAAGRTARDLMLADFPWTVPDEGLGRVLEKFEQQACERLPVLADAESRRLAGTISKRDILSVYSLDLIQRAARPRPSGALDSAVEALLDEVVVPAQLAEPGLDQARFRERYGLTVLMVRRADAGFIIPAGEMPLRAGDRLIVFGPRSRIDALKAAADRHGQAADTGVRDA